MANNLRKKLEKRIIQWNNNFPLDYWWRKKYNIPYGSKAHKEMSFIDMYYEFLEEKIMNESIEKENPNEKNLKKDENVDEDFDSLDLNKY